MPKGSKQSYTDKQKRQAKREFDHRHAGTIGGKAAAQAGDPAKQGHHAQAPWVTGA